MQERIARDSQSSSGVTVTHVHDLLALTLGATREAAEMAERPRRARGAPARDQGTTSRGNLEHGDLSVARSRRGTGCRRAMCSGCSRSEARRSPNTCSASASRARTGCCPIRAAPAEKIATIAFAAGFGDVSYFNRAFRRRYDVLPSDVRAQARRGH